MGKVITVAMHKGGAGKTTLLTNIVGAITVRQPEAKVLIIDTDGQANALKAFGGDTNNYTEGVHNIFLGTAEVEETVYELYENVHIIPALSEMDFLEFTLLLDEEKKQAPFNLLDNAIDKLKDKYDYIFIDTPPSMNLITGNALKVADHVIIPFQPEVYGVDGVVKIMATIQDLNETLGINIDILGIIGMKVDGRTDLHRMLLQDAKAFCQDSGLKMFDNTIPASIQYSNATAFEGLPATLVGKVPSNFVTPMYRLTEEIVTEIKRKETVQ